MKYKLKSFYRKKIFSIRYKLKQLKQHFCRHDEQTGIRINNPYDEWHNLITIKIWCNKCYKTWYIENNKPRKN